MIPSSSDAHLEQGKRWAHAFAHDPLSDEQAHAVGVAYVHQGSQRLSPVCDGELEGRPLRLVRLNQRLYGVHGTELWVSPTADRGMTFDELCRAYRAARHAPSPISVPHTEWLLHSFGVTARRWAEGCAHDDLREAFASVGLGGTVWSGTNDPVLLRRRKGYHHRTHYYLTRLGRALRAVRERLEPTALRTVWGMGLANGALVHWIGQGATPTERRYRCQALGVQPYLLPLALFCCGQTPGGPLSERESTYRSDAVPNALHWVGAQLSRAIDEGQAFQAPLAEALKVSGPGEHDVLRSLPQRQDFSVRQDDLGGATEPAPQGWTEADVRFLSGKKQGRGLRFFQAQHTIISVAPWELVAAARQLAPARQPRSKHDWKALEQLLSICRTPDQVVARLKGTPESWQDPYFERLEDRLRSVRDALCWLAQDEVPMGDPLDVGCGWHDVRRAQRLAALLGCSLSLRQLENLSRRLHARYRHLHETEAEQRLMTRAQDERERDQARAAIQWPPVLKAPVQVGGLRLVERTSWHALVEEGRTLAHCVGGWTYAQRCVTGHSRICSIETREGVRLSTLELVLRGHRLHCVQHYAFEDTMPSVEEQALVKAALLKHSLWHAGPWPVSSSAAALAEGDWDEDEPYREQELPYAQVGQLWDEAVQRYPGLAPYR